MYRQEKLCLLGRKKRIEPTIKKHGFCLSEIVYIFNDPYLIDSYNKVHP